MLNRGQLHMYSAYDGREKLLEKESVEPCNLRFAETLEGSMTFCKFKAFTLEGVDMGAKAVGINHPNFTTITLGLVSPGEKTTREEYWFGEGAKHETPGFWGVNPDKEIVEKHHREFAEGYVGDRGKSELIEAANHDREKRQMGANLEGLQRFEFDYGELDLPDTGGGGGGAGIAVIGGLLLVAAVMGGLT